MTFFTPVKVFQWRKKSNNINITCFVFLLFCNSHERAKDIDKYIDEDEDKDKNKEGKDKDED